MEDSAKMRLVKCPKCENILPEIIDYDVYQCGGCGAVLRAKDKYGRRGSKCLSEKSEDHAVGGKSATSEGFLGTRVVDSGSLDDDVKSHSGCDSRQLTKEDKRDICQNQAEVADKKGLTKSTIVVNGHSENLEKPIGREGKELNSIDSAVGSKISERMNGFPRNLRTDAVDFRCSSPKTTNEGLSNYFADTYTRGDKMWSQQKDHDAATRMQYLEQDRAELLRKLDDIKNQLNRSCNVIDEPKERFPSDERMLHTDSHGSSDARSPNVSAGLRRGSMQFSGTDRHAAGPSYTNQRANQFSYANGYGTSMHSFPASGHSTYVSGYQDPFGPQMLQRASKGLPYQFQRQPIHPYFSGKRPNNSDLFESYIHSGLLHHHTPCSCFYCCDVNQKGSVQMPSTTFGNRRFNDAASNPLLFPHEIADTFNPHMHDSSTTATACFQETKFGRWSNDLKPDMGQFMRSRLPNGVLHCCPVAGGAPFITCYNCFELLQMPRKALRSVRRHLQKLQCGACSTIMTVAVVNRKLVLLHHSESNRILTEVVNSSDEIAQNHAVYSCSHNNCNTAPNFSSDDYDNSGYDFQSTDKEPTSLTTDMESRNPQEMQNLHSSSPTTCDYENSPEVLITSREVVSSAPHPIQALPSPPFLGSPLREHVNYRVVNRFGRGNHSSRSEQEKVKMNKDISRQNSLKEAAVATELELSSNDYYNKGDSQESRDSVREDDQPRPNRGRESFFKNVIKKSFRDLIRSNQLDVNEKGRITVNGQIIPDRVVKKAEKLAGPMQPGKYWYDVRAGFWGSMGGPCLGIIPPFIEEFNYSMPENCCGGNTGVFVNGRELHQKDLELLSGRGLHGGRSYIIEISGRVFDEESGEELDSVGKLAPTVQKLKRGFGMKPPKVAEQR